MKHFIFTIFFLLAFLHLSAQKTEINGCSVTSFCGNETHKFTAYGNVFVETDPTTPVDLEVRIVDSPQKATYNVYKTNSPSSCGEWCFVTDRNKAKFTIRYVKDWEDCRIFFTNNRNLAGF